MTSRRRSNLTRPERPRFLFVGALLSSRDMAENNEKIEHIRHTLAHVLAQAVLEHHPSAKLALGPAIDNGFYYDVDFGTDKISDTDLPKFEESMRKNLPS